MKRINKMEAKLNHAITLLASLGLNGEAISAGPTNPNPLEGKQP